MDYNANRESSDEHISAFSICVKSVTQEPAPPGEMGQGLTLHTNRGKVHGLLHQPPGSNRGVIWVAGARGGFGGPARGIYQRLAETLRPQGITSLRLDYRRPNLLPECILDVIAGVTFFQEAGYEPVILVGHSFGSAVVIAAGAISPYVAGVVALSSQTYGANLAGQLSPRPLLVVHGKSDTRLPYYCGMQIYQWAREPKQLVLYDGAEHRLEESQEELDGLLTDWILATLAVSAPGRVDA